MPKIPSFFNRLDFISILLPGYVAIIAYLVVFQPASLIAGQGISFDVISAVVFIVAGPALGLTLQQLHRGLLSIYTNIQSKIHKEKSDKMMEYLQQYAAMRLRMNDIEQAKLDEAEAYIDFCTSTGISLCGLSFLGFSLLGFLRFEPYVFLIGGLILLATGYIERTDSYTPLFRLLADKHSKPPEISEY